MLGVRKIHSKANPAHPLYKQKFAATIDPPVGKKDLSQPEAKLLFPPKCSVWRSNTRGMWCCHLRNHHRFSEAWSRHGGDSHSAVVEVARKAWLLFLRDEQLAVKDCPIVGLFVDA